MGYIHHGEDQRAFIEGAEKMEQEDITDLLDSSKYFEEVLEGLNSAKNGDPEQKVKLAGATFRMSELETAFETFHQYVENNKEKHISENGEQLAKMIDDGFPATGILGRNADLRETALRCANNYLGLSHRPEAV